MKKKTMNALMLLGLFAFAAQAQEFGRNKIQYEAHNWSYIQSEHFDIYFYEGGEQAAETAAEIAERSYRDLMQLFNYRLKARIAIILYNSHNEFEDTNVSPGIQPEAVGGFTEFFKNRVVLPFEGSLEQYRHVIHHELVHAVMLQYFYGSGPGAIIQGISRLQLPGWFAEGLAEYGSIGWDTATDAIILDAVTNNYIPPVQQLDAFAYKGGQALWYYIAERYGREKITEIMSDVRTTRSVTRGMKKALGVDFEKLTEKWHKQMRRWYWPEVAQRQTPDELAKQLTDHVKKQNYVNTSPSLSPKGDKLAFIADRDGVFDVHLISTVDEKQITKLVSGERSADVEELHWLRPGITWSPDGKYIALAAKSGHQDVLYIVDVRKKKFTKSLRFDLDGVFSPAWSPDGESIAFVGLDHGQSDLYEVDLATGRLTQLTNDSYSDTEPKWSPDGLKIAFTSDRGDHLEAVERIDFSQHDFNASDVYVLHVESRKIERITTAPSKESAPAWFGGSDKLVFVSDRNGLGNIFLKDLSTGEVSALTNLISNAMQLSTPLEGNRLAFVSYYKGGYDIYLWKNPLEQPRPDSLILTDYIANRRKPEEVLLTEAGSEKEETKAALVPKDDRPFRNYVFAKGMEVTRNGFGQDSTNIALTPDIFKTPNGAFKKRKYTPKFSVDYAGAVGGYDPFFGIQGFTQVILSDLLGNHQIGIGANIIRSLANSDYSVSYTYLPKRLDVSFAAYHLVNFFRTDLFGSIERFRNYGAGLAARYPLNRFKRVDFALNWFNVRRDNLTFNVPGETLSTVLFNAGYTTDNTVWAYTGPFDGTRTNFSVVYSPKLGSNGLGFTTLRGDLRHYIKMGREYNVSIRLAAGASLGQDPPKFLLGGVPNWLNYRFASNIEFDLVRDFYFSEFVSPLRGADYYEKIGTKFFVTNIEFKFPLVQYFITRFPLPLGFFNIRGAGFLDVGAAWDDNRHFNAFKRDRFGNRVLDDIIAGFGWGLRTPFLIGLLRIDQAWRTDLDVVSTPRYYLSFGVDF